MSLLPAIPQPFEAALATEDFPRIEELWLEALDHAPIPTAELLEVRRRLWQIGPKPLARTLLELLADALEAADDQVAALAAIRELVRLTPKPPAELIERLEKVFAASRADSPSLAAVLQHYRLQTTRHPLDALEDMERWLDFDCGTVVEVQGQGVGRVVELNLGLENVKVDVGGRRPVSVPFGAVGRFLRLLPAGDFLRRKVEDLPALVELVAGDPPEALGQLLTSLGQPAEVAAIRAALDGVLPAEAWTSWWNKARKNPRIITSGAGSRLRYEITRSAEAATESLRSELETAAPRDRLGIARKLGERGPAATEETARVLIESLPALAAADPGLAWETANLVADLPGGAEVGEEWRRRLLEEAPPLRLLQGIQDRLARERVLEALRTAPGDGWVELWAEWMLHEDNPSLLERISRELDRGRHEPALDGALEAIFRNHVQHPAQFLWCCEAMTAPEAPEALRRRMTPSVLEKIPDTLSRKEFSGLRGRAKGLLDGGRVAIRLLLEEATPQQAQRFTQRVQRMGSVEPGRVRLVEQAAAQAHGAATVAAEAPLLAATRAAVEARRAELKELLEVEIPKTLKGINAAAAEGDLRENFEYHMLRDRQELQSARAAKLQRELGLVRLIEPGAADASEVNIGTVVHFEDDAVAPLTILGAWDADVDRRVYANGAEISQRLLGCRPGDEVEVEGRRARIARVEPWQG